MLTISGKKNDIKYICENCNFVSLHKSKYNRHLLTSKHKNLTNVDNLGQKGLEKIFTCECGKSYKHRQSLSLHKKKCEYQKYDNNIKDIKKDELKKETKIEYEDNKDELKSLIIKIMAENSENLKN